MASAQAPAALTVRDGQAVTVIAANSDIGALYGAFAYLRRVQTGQPLDGLDIVSAPRVRRRLLNHWDNLDGSIEPHDLCRQSTCRSSVRYRIRKIRIRD